MFGSGDKASGPSPVWGSASPLFLWLPFDVPEAVTDEKLGWAELTTHLEAETVEGDSQRLATLSDSPQEG